MLNVFARDFALSLPKKAAARAHIVGLSGELGAGKTAFVQEVAKVLGAEGTVVSPTFVFVRVHAIRHAPFTKLVHVDAYRMDTTPSKTIGWHEYMSDPHNLILVEWPENLPDFPNNAPILKFSVVGEDTRHIAYAPYHQHGIAQDASG